jgi:hypothetical protein
VSITLEASVEITYSIVLNGNPIEWNMTKGRRT